MESQEEEYKHSIWEIYRKEWATASPEKRTELNKRMLRWQELMENGWTASRAYYRVMEEDLGKAPSYSFWAKMRKAPLIILGLALVAAIVYCVVITVDRNALNAELESVQSRLTSTKTELASTQGDLNSTKQKLTSIQSELTSTKTELASTQAELTSTEAELTSTKQTFASTQKDLEAVQTDLSSTKQTLASTQTELSSTKQSLSSAQNELEASEAKLSSTQQQLAVAQETLEGLGITLSTSKECYDVALIDNPTATNPTWSQLKTFLFQDRTEKHTYIEDVYDCSEFSMDVHNNAEAAGIRGAVVHVDFRNELVGHALNAFLTTDYGLVYIDCTRAPDTITRAPDTIARVKTGKEYRAVDLRKYYISVTNVRNDDWWDALDGLNSPYYSIPSSTLIPLPSFLQGHMVTSSIKIYW